MRLCDLREPELVWRFQSWCGVEKVAEVEKVAGAAWQAVELRGQEQSGQLCPANTNTTVYRQHHTAS